MELHTMTANRRVIHKQGNERYVLVMDGMGGFLDPPGAVTHSYSLEWWRHFNCREADSMMSIPSALEDETIPNVVKIRLRRLLAEHPPQMTEEWVRSVYAYYHSCYSPDGKDRNVSNCLIVKPDPEGSGYLVGTFGRDGKLDERPPAEHHLAYLSVRKHFPDHEPRTDLIENPPPWGNATKETT